MLLKDTGMRRGEAWILKWSDIDSNQRTVNVKPEKGSRPRLMKISPQTHAMLLSLPRRSEFVFGGGNLQRFCAWFFEKRKEIANRLQNPRIRSISFKTFRHFKATMEYHRTKDILHVMNLLGHKNIKNTLVYTHLVDFGDDDYVCKVAKTIEEAKALIEAGFEYVTEVNGEKLFRKWK